VFNAFLSSRAVPATPEERFGAPTEHLPEACCLRPLCRGSASSCTLEATSRFAARYGPRFRSRRIAARRHPGSASTGHLAVSRREPGYSIAQSLIEVGSFHPTRNAPLHGAHKVVLEVRSVTRCSTILSAPNRARTSSCAEPSSPAFGTVERPGPFFARDSEPSVAIAAILQGFRCLCPGCGEKRLIDFDPVRRVWNCAVCGRSWQ
jgi:ribosomal protein L37AE/L43A